MEENNTMTFSLLLGSTRGGRAGPTVAKWIARALEERGHTVHVIDPNEYDELLVMRTPWHYRENPAGQIQEVHELLDASDGFVIVSAEYNHSFSGAIKNVLDNFMPEYARKPFAIATYSASPLGGVRANEALRPVISELKGVATPIPLMIPQVQDAFDENGAVASDRYAELLTRFLDDLEWYASALKTAREEEPLSSRA